MKNTQNDPKTQSSMLGNAKGQLSIFIGVVIITLITMMAFVVNIGLYVKARINLQNAVDAAAWSGAATQSRQLTKIAWLNWELHNVYKEWMFKYYAIGNMANPNPFNNSPSTNFRLKSTFKNGEIGYNPNDFDKFNIPSICIEFGNSSLCDKYSIPGLPDFASSDITGTSNITTSIFSTLTDAKSQNCAERSSVNFQNAFEWAYGVGEIPDINAGTRPNILFSKQPGAYFKALELGFRIRNLEQIVNTEAITLTASGLNSLPDQNTFEGMRHERVYKAFDAAYRNFSPSSGNNPELKDTFVLKEIQPELIGLNYHNKTLNGFLIPETDKAKKIYLDLVAMPVNFVTFFSFFSPRTSSVGQGNSQVKSAADCSMSRTALPIPSYLMGFYKNPEVMTYYAVSGEAKFTGLFYPFAGKNPEGLTLKAYAAAKPFGGRIGPMTFVADQTKQLLQIHVAGARVRSRPFASAIDVSQLRGEFKAGDPIPNGLVNGPDAFWADPTKNANRVIVGGTGANVTFVIPNLLFDINKYSDDKEHEQLGRDIHPITLLSQSINYDAANNPNGDPLNNKTNGLYDKNQFDEFHNLMKTYAQSFVAGTPSAVPQSSIYVAALSARTPTNYDKANYLIPAAEDGNTNNTENFAQAIFDPNQNTLGNSPGLAFYDVKIRAPLIGSDLYETESILTNYFNTEILTGNVAKAMTVYKNALGAVAASIWLNGKDYRDAANKIAPLRADGTYGSQVGNPDPKCNSIWGKFHYMTSLSSGTACGSTGIYSLTEYAMAYFNQRQNNDQDYNLRVYVANPKSQNPVTETKAPDVWSAYVPSRKSDNLDGILKHPLSPSYGYKSLVEAKRNFYSTKFIALKNLTNDKNHEIQHYFEDLNIAQATNIASGDDFGMKNGLGEGYTTLEAIFGELNL